MQVWILVQLKQMSCELAVSCLVRQVFNREYKVKPINQSWRHIYLVCNHTIRVESSKFWVCSSKNGSSGNQCCLYICFGNAHRLLFERFMHCRSVLWRHLIHLIDAANSIGSKNQCASFQAPTFKKLISNNS